MTRPLFLFAPGAGAPSSHPWIRGWVARLETIGLVAAFDYDYVRPEMAATNELFVVDGGDHSLAVTKRQLKANGETQEDVDTRILSGIQSFIRRRAKID